MFTASETRVQQTIQSALGALADPSAQFSVSNGACVASRLMLGQSIKNFVPIHAMLPPVTAPGLRDVAPNSQVPGASAALTHPAINEGWTTLVPDEALSELDSDLYEGAVVALAVK